MYTIAKLSHELLDDGETVSYIRLPKDAFTNLQPGLVLAEHLSPILDLHVNQSPGISIIGNTWPEIYAACIYTLRKYEHDTKTKNVQPDNADSNQKPLCKMFNRLIYDRAGSQSILIVAKYEHIEQIYRLRNEDDELSSRAMRYLYANDTKPPLPVWASQKYPIVVTYKSGTKVNADLFASADRFIIFVCQHISNKGEVRPRGHNEIFEFELGYKTLQIGTPNDDYYLGALKHMATQRGLRFSGVDPVDILNRLKNFRAIRFSGIYDIDLLVNRLKSAAKPSLEVTKDIIENLLILEQRTGDRSRSRRNVRITFSDLVGLEKERRALENLVAKLKYNQARRQAGYPQPDDHLVAVFIGAPGTAKTTVARIFGQMLEDEGVLRTAHFCEINRSHLIGKYVGHTAQAVRTIFAENKGGVIFVDEAYALDDPKGYGPEAMAQLVVEIENNPDTLVIFAGYIEPMKRWITNSNEGLRSRLTNVIEFQNYTIAEMCEIFSAQLKLLGYATEDYDAVTAEVKRFIERVTCMIHPDLLGNGRFIRKLVRTSITFKALRDPNEYETVSLDDVKQAIKELEMTELVLLDNPAAKRSIGF